MILKIFLYGMLAALPAALIEMGVLKEFNRLNLFSAQLNFFESGTNNFLFSILNIFIGVALIEEFLKYLVVKGKVMNSPELDEPIDIVLYMIISALGFAASENILILFSLGSGFLFGTTLSISIFRFLGATFLHALCSGTFGYFLALSFFETKKRGKFLMSGLGIATILHGLYNFSIMEMKGFWPVLTPILILLGLAVFLAFAFQKLKKIKSVCKI